MWLITLLANQSILIYNLWNETKKPLLTEEAVELLTSPYDLAEYKTAIMTAMSVRCCGENLLSIAAADRAELRLQT